MRLVGKSEIMPALAIRFFDFFREKFKRAWIFILDVVFPKECLGCGREGAWLCFGCFGRLPFKRCQSCPACGRENDFGGVCPACREGVHLDGILAAGDYGNSLLAEAIKTFKYRFIRDLGADLGKFLADFADRIKNDPILALTSRKMLDPANANTVILAIPLHPRRERWRGFNQAEVLRQALGAGQAETGEPIGRLRRIKHRRPQARLKGEERRENIVGCFAWQGGSLENKNVILVDDVATTGATMNEAARVLKAAGAKKVWGLAVAKG